MYICIYLYVYICICRCVHIYLHVDCICIQYKPVKCIWTYVYIPHSSVTPSYVCVCVSGFHFDTCLSSFSTPFCMCVCTYACASVHMHMHACMYVWVCGGRRSGWWTSLRMWQAKKRRSWNFGTASSIATPFFLTSRFYLKTWQKRFVSVMEERGEGDRRQILWQNYEAIVSDMT